MPAGVEPNEEQQRAFRVGKMALPAQHFGEPLPRQAEHTGESCAIAAPFELCVQRRHERIPKRSIEARFERLAAPGMLSLRSLRHHGPSSLDRGLGELDRQIGGNREMNRKPGSHPRPRKQGSHLCHVLRDKDASEDSRGLHAAEISPTQEPRWIFRPN